MLWFSLGVLLILGYFAYQLSDYRRRRLLYSSWRRLVRWEFWPMSVFYIPVAIYILYLGIRYKGFTLFTAANPGIPHGGVALMSKSEILKGLMDLPERVATFVLIPSELSQEEKMGKLRGFMDEYSLSFPIVLKPDFGERGKGVGIINNENEAFRYLEGSSEAVIAQKYVPGIEFGVFYMRHPDSERGRVPSITAKLPTYVTGDGVRTLEQLILDDQRAVCMARFFLAKFEDCLHEVIPVGETFTLASLGTHSRGSLFLDANDIWTEELEAAFDTLSQSFDGFFVGRYDVRVDSLESIKQGENFKVVELNGVVSEPTHMYDPKHGLLYAYRTMFRLWNEIFRIGHANRSRGFPSSSLNELRQLMQAFQSQEKLEV